MKIQDKKGNIVKKIWNNSKTDLLFSYSKEFDTLDDLNLSSANFSNIIAEGLMAIGTNFTGSNFSNSDLYWAYLAESIFCKANLENVDLRGAVLDNTNFEKANMRNVNLGPDNLGRSTPLLGVNLKKANLNGAILDKVEYDEYTIFPDGFNTKNFNMINISENPLQNI